MVSAKPLIVSDVPPMKRIVEATECGLSYIDYEIDELVDILRKLNDEEYRKKLGENGRRAVLEEFNWSREEKALALAIDDLRKVDSVEHA